MRTEDITAYEITLGPAVTLVLFSLPDSGKSSGESALSLIRQITDSAVDRDRPWNPSPASRRPDVSLLHV